MIKKLSKSMMVISIIIIPLLFSCATTKDAKFYNNRGNAYYSKGQYDQAISDFNKALEINPRYALAYNNRGVAYYFKREYEKSWKDVEKAQSLGYQIHPEFLEELRKASGREK